MISLPRRETPRGHRYARVALSGFLIDQERQEDSSIPRDDLSRCLPSNLPSAKRPVVTVIADTTIDNPEAVKKHQE